MIVTPLICTDRVGGMGARAQGHGIRANVFEQLIEPDILNMNWPVKSKPYCCRHATAVWSGKPFERGGDRV